jgi:hypothetical protein
MGMQESKGKLKGWIVGGLLNKKTPNNLGRLLRQKDAGEHSRTADTEIFRPIYRKFKNAVITTS